MAAPVNVKLPRPNIPLPNWQVEEAEWMALNQDVSGNPYFYPLTVKAAYVVGIVHDHCTSATCLLGCSAPKQATYIPAWGACAAAIELLGRCLHGNSNASGAVADIEAGLAWLSGGTKYQTIPSSTILVSTSTTSYNIATLAALRHFAAHGQATAKMAATGKPQIGTAMDFEILEHVGPLMGPAVDLWWNELQNSDELCNRLAQSNILRFREWPVFRSWALFTGDPPGSYPSITDIFANFSWRA